ncbi:VanZ family protein [Paenibacillus hodogayensis]|uniref:VanZ family protein n=1 Tax=Paenibacillus hodogayensis TaxID=279208 RepID=A0ABV5VSX4_9BACL
MLDAYWLPIGYALLTFPMLAFLFTLPFLVIQYRKYGYLNKIRVLVIYSLLLYLLTALYLVILPLPATRNTCSGLRESYMSWIPFQFVNDFLRETGVRFAEPSTYLRLFRERAFLQAAFNVLLLVPLGVYLRYYFRFGPVKAIAAAFGLSLFFEITQVTGLYGIYMCPYRLFDVDDLMLNTLGGAVGYAAAPLLTKLLPEARRLDERVDLKTERIGFTRRLVALQLDLLVLLPLLALFMKQSSLVIYGAVCFGYFIVLPYVTNGRTLGKFIVRIRVKGKGPRIRLHELLIRYGVLYGAIGGVNAALFDQYVRGLPPIGIAACFLTAGLVDLVFAVHAAPKLFRKDKTLFYERWSRTEHEIV